MNKHPLIASVFSLLAVMIFSASVRAGEPEKVTKPPKVESGKAEEKKAPAKKAEKPDPAEKKAKAKPEEKKTEAKPEEKKTDAKEESEEKTHKVKAESFEITLELGGVVESLDEAQVALRPKSWSSLSVISAVPHGTEVKKGDVLIELETDKLEEAIEDQKAGVPQQELALQDAKRDLEKLEKTTPLSLESARRSKMKAEEDFAYFQDVSKPMRVRDAHEDLKSTANYLAYAEEELNQLKKMYEQDDLTEETEEIILLRAQNSVDNYKWMLEQTKARTDRSLNTLIPREEESMQRSLESRQIEWRVGEQSLRSALEAKRLEVAKADRDFEKSQEKLGEMEEDLKMLTVRAPQDGVVYYGMSQRGKWTTAATVERKLIPGGTLSPREVVMTVANPDKLQLRVSVPEDKLKDLEKGQKAKTTLKWSPDDEFTSTLKEVSYIPFSNNTFDSVFTMNPGKELTVYPGMSAKLEIEVYNNEKALLVPKGAVKEEDDAEFVVLKGGKKQKVETGRSNDKMTEILKGLKEGDEIQLSPEDAEKPEEKTPEKSKPGESPEKK